MRALPLLFIFVASARADDRTDRNLVYGEVLGKGGLYGVGYERLVLPGLGIGLAGSYSLLRGETTMTASPYVHATALQHHAHAAYLELGAIVARTSVVSSVPDWAGMTQMGAGGFASAGYEHGSRHVVVRIGAGVAAGRAGFQPLAGVAIGFHP